MLNLSVIFLLFTFILYSLSSNLQSKLLSLVSDTLCNTATNVDLSSLTQTSGNDYTFYDDPTTKVSYTMNVCANTLVSCSGSKTSPMIYYTGDSSIPCYQLGQLDTASWSGNTVYYSNGDPCNDDGPLTTWSGSINFVCGTQLADLNMIEKTGCKFQYTLTTKLVCGHDPVYNNGDGINMGLVAFLCVFFGGFFIYFAIGMGYNYYYRAEGSEVSCYALLPDKDIWLYIYYLCKLPFSWCGLIDKPVYVKSSPSDDITSNSSSKYGAI